MLRAILHGPASLKKGSTPKSACSVAGKWGITGVTPGAIAFVAVVVSNILLLCLIV